MVVSSIQRPCCCVETGSSTSAATSGPRSRPVRSATSATGTWYVRNGPSGGTPTARFVISGRLVEDEGRRPQHRAVRGPGRHLPELPGDGDAAVHRVVVGEHRAREHRQPQPVGARIRQHVVLEPDPQPLTLVERGRLRCRVRIGEGLLVGDGRGGTPDRVTTTDQVPAVEVVVRVQLRTALLAGRNTRVEVPVVATRDVLEVGAVDVHRRRRGEPAHRVEQHGEVHRGQLAHGLRGSR